MATAGFAGAWSPINDDETKTHYHKQEADSSKTGSLEERSDWIHYRTTNHMLFRSDIEIDRNVLLRITLWRRVIILYVQTLI